jgi:hypothetical protein
VAIKDCMQCELVFHLQVEPRVLEKRENSWHFSDLSILDSWGLIKHSDHWHRKKYIIQRLRGRSQISWTCQRSSCVWQLQHQWPWRMFIKSFPFFLHLK